MLKDTNANTATKERIKGMKKVKVTISYFDGKERKREVREIYRFCEE